MDKTRIAPTFTATRGVKIDLSDNGYEFKCYITDELVDCITE